ncbi:MAG: glutathione S-transferase N-terminal domain-containing protein [Deltaproteobacteria bacterium]|nr:glutathione S-transferase N-terminal domain-containing protein [Deltaproteobacteria bacterium]
MASPNPRANDPTITLYEFSLSHYNEKARWALDYKGIPYRSRPVLPGFHQGILRRLSGQTRTPVLQIDDEVIAGSAEIVARVDALSSDRPLFPEAPDARVEAEEWVRWLDKEGRIQRQTDTLPVGISCRLAGDQEEIERQRCERRPSARGRRSRTHPRGPLRIGHRLPGRRSV